MEVLASENDIVIEPEINDGSGQKHGAAESAAKSAWYDDKVLDILVLYTSDANQAVSNINNTAHLAAGQISNAYWNSSLNSYMDTHVNLVTLLSGFSETSDIEADLYSLRSNSTAQSLRNSYRADIVVLLTDGNYNNSGTYGIAFVQASSSYAYAIVEADRALSNYTFAHEVGHLQGGRHQQCSIYYTDTCDNTSSYAHGYGWSSSSGYKYTIMHELKSSATRIQYYSNPSISYNGNATGISNSNDNALKFRNTIATMAGFRTSFLHASITGPTSGCSGYFTWNSSVYGGNTPYSYYWEESEDGFNYSYGGSSSSYTGDVHPWVQYYYLRLTVNSNDGQVDQNWLTFENWEGTPYCGGFKREGIDVALGGQLPTEYALKGAYPNPFNPTTTIAYSLPVPGNVRLVVYDMVGREVKSLVNKFHGAGHFQVQLDASDLPNGVYTYQLEAPEFSESRRIVLMK